MPRLDPRPTRHGDPFWWPDAGARSQGVRRVSVRWAGAVVVAMLLALAGVRLSAAEPAQPSEPTQPNRPAAARASGLPWASGVFSHDSARTAEFARTRGRPVDILAVFPTRDSWATLLQAWWMSPSAVPDGFTGTLNVGLPLFPDDGSLDAAAAGTYDEQWRQMGALIASRYPDAWVRPGWEMNIPDWKWSADPGNVEQYKQAFRRASTALKAGGPNLRIVFNPNEGRGGSLPDARDAYPGDAYVDDIGLDAYDWHPGYDAAGWQEHRTKDQGWDFWADFARAHGKTFSVPEWGVIPGNTASGGDNPEYIAAVLDWMRDHADVMSFDTYFEEPEPYCRCALSLNPKAQAAYTAKIGELAAAGPALAGPAPAGPTASAAAPAPSLPVDSSPAAPAEQSTAPAVPSPPPAPGLPPRASVGARDGVVVIVLPPAAGS